MNLINTNYKTFKLKQNNSLFHTSSSPQKTKFKHKCFCCTILDYIKDIIKYLRMSLDTSQQNHLKSPEDTSQDRARPTEEIRVKRKVALHLGYIGSNYYGNSKHIPLSLFL